MSENTWGFLTMTMIGWRREDAANQARVWIKRYDIATSLSILLLVSICGCREPAPPDEPRAAGIAANRAAAVDRFTPASYDYFRGMDSEAVLSGETDEVSAANDTGQAEKESASPPNPTSLEPKASSQRADKSSDRSNSRTDKTVIAPRGYMLEEPKWSDNEIKGRNAWILWTAGNEAFWDWLARHGYGTIDLLKLVDSRQRSSRFARAGMINEPGTRACTEEEAKQTYGIYLDRLVDSTDDHYRQMMRPASPAYSDPSDNELDNETSLPKKYSKQPASDVYGYSTGIVGLRLFKNPEFTGAAVRRWNAKRFYDDRKYATDPETIRPYRVGMSCAFCHVAPHPLNPPTERENPQWENLSSIIGNQYLRVRETFGNQTDPSNYFYHLLDSQLPGTIDTSLIASDNINNANTMNAVFGLSARVRRSLFNPAERLSPASSQYPGVWDAASYPDDPLGDFQAHYDELEGNPRHVPRILVDGSDGVGSWVALARVYFNIGSYHQNWIRLHNTNLGFRQQQPFKLKDAEEQSVYWHATLARIDPMTDFFLRSSTPMKLRDAVGVNKLKSKVSLETLHDDHTEARETFARTCIACHSSIQPGNLEAVDKLALVSGVEDLSSLQLTRDDLWQLARGNGQLPEHYRQWAEKAVELPAFWSDNYLSTDMRLPVNLVGTHSARAVATNAMHNQMWEDFSSHTYRELEPIGEIRYHDPFSQSSQTYRPPGGGPGYYRVPTLISAWATAPFFHNNSLGDFNNDPSVLGRVAAFDDAMQKLLWPERRISHDRSALDASATIPESDYASDRGLIWRTSEISYLTIESHQVPGLVFGLTGWRSIWLTILPWIPTLVAVLIGSLLLFSEPIRRRTKILREKVKWLDGVISFLQWAIALALMGAAVAVGIILVANWRSITFWETVLDWQLPWIRLQLSFAILLVTLLGYLAIQSKLPLPSIQYRQARIAGLACFLIAAVFALGFGAFLSGQGGGVRVGPFPKGMPVNLLANVDPASSPKAKLAAGRALEAYFHEAKRRSNASGSKADSGESLLELFERTVAPRLLEISKCPDLVMDRGHDYVFLRDLTDDQKQGLLELVKTF